MKPAEKKLLKLFSQLTTQQRDTLTQFAEFLASRQSDGDSADQEIAEPVLRERPAEETVVAAIKRLTASYPMLDRDKLFNDTSTLMTRHVMQGEEAKLIIDELEQLFASNYQRLLDESVGKESGHIEKNN